jgi:ATP-dependent RNA helicase DDX10/DBP4
LDQGFLPQISAIIEHLGNSRLPSGRPERQTLLFSATQKKELAQLVQLSLYEPVHINCNAPGDDGMVPEDLKQTFVVVPLERKLNLLWGFLKASLKKKIMVFATTKKQVSNYHRCSYFQLNFLGSLYI